MSPNWSENDPTSHEASARKIAHVQFDPHSYPRVGYPLIHPGLKYGSWTRAGFTFKPGKCIESPLLVGGGGATW